MRSATAELGGFKKILVAAATLWIWRSVWSSGAAFGAVVQALMNGLITPLLGAFGGVPAFSSWTIPVGAARLLIGDFLNA